MDLELSVEPGYAATAYYTNGNAISWSDTWHNYTLPMPAENVTITAELTDAPITTYYTDENGEMVDNVDAIPLDNTRTTLATGTYVVNENITFTTPVTLEGDVVLILADGCTMTIDDATGSDIGLNGKISNGVFHGLTVYGQTEQTGTLVVTDASTTGIGADATYNGGIINATSIGGTNITINRGTIGPVPNSSTVVATNLVINGGVVNAKLSVTPGNLTINGGQISTPDSGLGITVMRGTLTLGCSNYSDFIYANKYTILSSTVVVKEGQTLTDGTNLYTGTLTTAQLTALANKTLRLGVYREIAGYGDSDGGYVLIASPLAESVAPTYD